MIPLFALYSGERAWVRGTRLATKLLTGGPDMKKWSKPGFQNMRYGFEINLYIKAR